MPGPDFQRRLLPLLHELAIHGRNVSDEQDQSGLL